MQKIPVTLDLSKIDKSRIIERKYTDKAGVEHVAREYKIDIVPLKAEKFVTEGSWGKMFKTHFVVQAQTKEERKNNTDSVFIGDGFRFEYPDNDLKAKIVEKDEGDYGLAQEEVINPDNIPW